MKYRALAALALIILSFIQAEANETESIEVPVIFKAVMEGDAAKVLEYARKGGDLDARWETYDDSPLITLSPDLTMTSLLIHLGADPKQKSKSNVSALMTAGRNGDLAQARLLVENGLSVHASDKHGRHVIHFATGNFNPQFLQWLLDEGADPNAINSKGATTLMESMYYPDINEIKILLEHGADPNIKDEKGQNAVDYLNLRKSYHDPDIYRLAYNLVTSANKSE